VPRVRNPEKSWPRAAALRRKRKQRPRARKRAQRTAILCDFLSNGAYCNLGRERGSLRCEGPRRLTAQALAPIVHCVHALSAQRSHSSLQADFHTATGFVEAHGFPCGSGCGLPTGIRHPPGPPRRGAPTRGIVRAAQKGAPQHSQPQGSRRRNSRPATGLWNSETRARRCPPARCTIALQMRPTGAPRGGDASWASGEGGARPTARSRRVCARSSVDTRAKRAKSLPPLTSSAEPQQSIRNARRKPPASRGLGHQRRRKSARTQGPAVHAIPTRGQNCPARS